MNNDKNETINLLILLFVSGCFWGIAISSGAQMRSWDGATHIFFSKGYADNWWTLWDDRWYGGFNKASYPPLAHQLVGLLISATGQIEFSYSIFLWLFLTVFPLATYKYSMIFFDKNQSLVAGYLAIFIPATRLMVFTFGQFAGFISLIFLFLSLSSYSDFIQKRSWLSGYASVGWFGCVASTHTNTFFLLTPILFISTGLYLLQKSPTKQTLINSFKIALLYFLISIIVIFPFWIWFLGYKMQTPIMHPSRWNLLSLMGTGIFRLYFLDIHGYFLLAYLLLAVSLYKDRSYIILFTCFLVYFLLGLGGSTVLPKLIFGRNWEWLTYERFGIWAATISLPTIGYITQKSQNSSLGLLLKIIILATIFNAFAWVYNPNFSQITRPQANLKPIYDILNSNPQCKERFLSLGFDYQLPDFSTYANAKTLDGLWHTARTDSFLTQSGMGSLDTALYWQNGELLLREFLERKDIVPANCIFINETNLSNAAKYKVILLELGWHKEKINGGAFSFWTKRHKLPMQENLPPHSKFLDFQVLLWGVLPIFNLCMTISLEAKRCKVNLCESRQ